MVGKKGVAMRITAKCQVTIPQDVRERAGLMPGMDVEFEIEAGVVRRVKATTDAGPVARSWSTAFARAVTSK
jgi:AbrB family looped-hinge helix DNA binding protein